MPAFFRTSNDAAYRTPLLLFRTRTNQMRLAEAARHIQGYHKAMNVLNRESVLTNMARTDGRTDTPPYTEASRVRV